MFKTRSLDSKKTNKKWNEGSAIANKQGTKYRADPSWIFWSETFSWPASAGRNLKKQGWARFRNKFR